VAKVRLQRYFLLFFLLIPVLNLAAMRMETNCVVTSTTAPLFPIRIRQIRTVTALAMPVIPVITGLLLEA